MLIVLIIMTASVKHFKPHELHRVGRVVERTLYIRVDNQLLKSRSTNCEIVYHFIPVNIIKQKVRKYTYTIISFSILSPPIFFD